MLFVGMLVITVDASALEFDRYHNQDEINSYLRVLAADHPNKVKFDILGLSQEGREISYVVVGSPSDQPKSAIYLNGTHHGNEKSSTEAVLGLLDYLVENFNDPLVYEILRRYDLYIQPLVNPDGHAEGSRFDINGIDLNRDYAHSKRTDKHSFKSVETKLVKDLAERVPFRAAIAFHSGMKGVLWPWCDSNKKGKDHDLFFTLSKHAALAMDMDLYSQSYHDFPTSGELIDYLYMTYGTLAVTFEVSQAHTPSRKHLSAIVKRSVLGSMTYLANILDHDRGQLALEIAPPMRISRSTSGPIPANRH
jgi:predicted deacylase